MFSSTRAILENTVPMTECRSPQLLFVPRAECTTPDSQTTMYEFPFDPEEYEANHRPNLRPRRPEPRSPDDLPLFSYLPGPDHINRDDYFGDWSKANCNDDGAADKGKGKEVERETYPMEGPSAQWWKDLNTISSPPSSCDSVSPCSQRDFVSIYHQQNIPLPRVALANSEPFEDEGCLHTIPEAAVPFDSSYQTQDENTIRIEIPAKFGPEICEQMYQGMKDVFQTAYYDIHPSTENPQCIHNFFQSFSSTSSYDSNLSPISKFPSVSTAPTTPATSPPPTLEFFVREDCGNKRKWSQIDLIRKESRNSDLESIEESYYNPNHPNSQFRTTTPSPAPKHRKPNKNEKYLSAPSSPTSPILGEMIRIPRISKRYVEVPRGNFGDVSLKPTTAERAKRGWGSVSEGARDVVFVARDLVGGFKGEVGKGWRRFSMSPRGGRWSNATGYF